MTRDAPRIRTVLRATLRLDGGSVALVFPLRAEMLPATAAMTRDRRRKPERPR